MGRELFSSVFKVEYGDLDAAARRRVLNEFYRGNYAVMRWGAIVILACQILFILRDCLAGFYAAHSLNYINLGAELFMCLASELFLLSISDPQPEWTENRTGRVAYCLYMASLILVVCAFTFTDTYVRHTPLGVCVCFLFVPTIAPSSDMRRQTAIFAIVLFFSAAVYFQAMDDGPLGVINVVIVPCLLFVTSCFLRSNNLRVLVYREQTRLLTEELLYRNRTDFLTDVSNRLCMYGDYDAARERGEALGAVIYDIDDFKKYNDSFSHLAGDDCLRVTCGAVKALAQANNGTVYRYGGEEFVVMFFGATEERFRALVPMVNSVIYDLKLEHASTALHPYISVSVGGTYCADLRDSLEMVLLKCDKALYEAKSQGKNCAVIL